MEENKDEISLSEIARVIIRQQGIIVCILLIGCVTILAVNSAPVDKRYEAVGYYNALPTTQKHFLFFNLEKDKKSAKQLIPEAILKYPTAQIGYPLEDTERYMKTNILSIKTTGKTAEEAKEKCQKIADTLPLKEVMPILSSEIPDSRKKKKIIKVGIMFFIASILSGFIRDWCQRNKEKS